MTFSSHGTDMGLIGKSEDGNSWCQWTVDEEARAEIKFIEVTKETFPLGLAVDFTSNKLFPSSGMFQRFKLKNLDYL